MLKLELEFATTQYTPKSLQIGAHDFYLPVTSFKRVHERPAFACTIQRKEVKTNCPYYDKTTQISNEGDVQYMKPEY